MTSKLPQFGNLWKLFIYLVLSASFMSSQSAIAQNLPAKLKVADGHAELLVDGKPFLIRGGELHNSTSSSIPYMDQHWASIKKLNVNTVLAAVTWQQFEPTEGQFDYTIIDHLIASAEKHDMRMIILWFGSWKNGQSSYSPLWVRQNAVRFPRVQTKDGRLLETLSVFSPALLDADRRAYVELNRRIRAKDPNHRIIMMQPQNEVGLLGTDFDYSPLGRAALQRPVPQQLLSYLVANKASLRPEVAGLWRNAGYKPKGTWLEVFGDNIHAREALLAWSYASFINQQATAGRQVLDLPTFVNAWIVQNDKELPGAYPAGGPVSRVMDIYKAAAPKIDFLAPDIYLADFRSITKDYTRKDNPLFIPESTIDAGRAFFAIGELGALGYSPFGIEDAAGNRGFASGYGVLAEIEPLLLDARRKGRDVRAAMRQGDERFTYLDLDDMRIIVDYTSLDQPAYGMVIRTGPLEFYIAGVNVNVRFESKKTGEILYIADVFEGEFRDQKWLPGRLLNGDETFHNERVRVYGRTVVTGPTFATDVDLPPQPTASALSANATKNGEITPPGIYQVRLYRR